MDPEGSHGCDCRGTNYHARPSTGSNLPTWSHEARSLPKGRSTRAIPIPPVVVFFSFLPPRPALFSLSLAGGRNRLRVARTPAIARTARVIRAPSTVIKSPTKARINVAVMPSHGQSECNLAHREFPSCPIFTRGRVMRLIASGISESNRADDPRTRSLLRACLERRISHKESISPAAIPPRFLANGVCAELTVIDTCSRDFADGRSYVDAHPCAPHAAR